MWPGRTLRHTHRPLFLWGTFCTHCEAINNETKKIYITASQGNFINKDEVLLNENVRFKSNDFSIETEKVIFNRDKQTAKSKTKSMFKSKDATITSDGFNIHDKGNKIIFYGNSYIILK